MNHINRTIVVAGIVIGTFGLVRVWTSNTNQKGASTRVILACYIVVIVLALVELLIPASTQVVNAFAMLTMMTVIFASGVIQWLGGLFPSAANAGGGGAHGVK